MFPKGGYTCTNKRTILYSTPKTYTIKALKMAEQVQNGKAPKPTKRAENYRFGLLHSASYTQIYLKLNCGVITVTLQHLFITKYIWSQIEYRRGAKSRLRKK